MPAPQAHGPTPARILGDPHAQRDKRGVADRSHVGAPPLCRRRPPVAPPGLVCLTSTCNCDVLRLHRWPHQMTQNFGTMRTIVLLR